MSGASAEQCRDMGRWTLQLHMKCVALPSLRDCAVILLACAFGMTCHPSVAQQVSPDWATPSVRVRPIKTTGTSPTSPAHTTALFRTQTAMAAAPHSGKGKIATVSGHQSDASNTAALPLESGKSIDLGPGPDFASQLQDDESHLIQFIEVMQWTVVVLLLAVVAVIALKKYSRPGLIPARTSDIAHLATLPIKNHFQAHLLAIGAQKFLVTTDRTGVKTVNPITSWEQFEDPLQQPQETPAV